MNILLVAVKKSFTKKWLSHESPTLKAWMEITMDIYKLEKIKAMLNLNWLNLYQQMYLIFHTLKPNL